MESKAETYDDLLKSIKLFNNGKTIQSYDKIKLKRLCKTSKYYTSRMQC